MQVLITGGAGFIGSHLLQRLHGKPGLQLTVVDNLDTGCRDYVPADVEFIQADIRSQELEAHVLPVTISTRLCIWPLRPWCLFLWTIPGRIATSICWD
jgi:UDP-glucose 4-epimerase